MMCLKCGQKETLKYSEKCEDCEQKDTGVIWTALAVLILLMIFTAFQLVNSIKASVLLFNIGYYHFLPLVAFEFICALIILCLAIYVTFLFWERKKKMPSALMILLLLNIIFCLIDLALIYFFYKLQLSSDHLFWLGRTVFFSILWGAYFLLSEKVKQVFVN